MNTHPVRGVRLQADPVRRFVAALVIALAASACSGPTDPSRNATDTFSGVVQPLQSGPVHTFNVPNLGEIAVTVTAMTPPNAVLGIGYGQLTGSNCGLIQQNAIASTSVGRAALNGQIITKGTYCVVLFDPIALIGSGLTLPESYTVQVSHP